jgi:hypothetical protein
VALSTAAGLIALLTSCGSQTPGAASLSPGGGPGGGLARSAADSNWTGSGGLVSPASSSGNRRSAHGTPASVAPGSPGTTTGNRSGVSGNALFGGTEDMVKEEPALGRKLAIVRTYYSLGEKFPTRTDSRLMSSGRTLLVSLDIMTKGPTYASVAVGRQDAQIGAFLKAMNRSAVQYHLGAIYIGFEHEANVVDQHATVLGTPSQFVSAWDHIHQLAAAAHLDWNQGGRLHWVLILTHRAYIPMSARAPWALRMGAATAYWPGNNEVDIVAADGYDSPGCKRGTTAQEFAHVSPASVFGPLLSFARAHGGMPVFVAEWGASATFASAQLGFIRQMGPFVTSNPQIAAVSYWDSMGVGCSYSFNNHPASVSALRVMGHTAGLQGSAVMSG